MGFPRENSLECIKCGLCNIQCTNAVILGGNCYCISCLAKRPYLLKQLNEIMKKEEE